MKKCLLFIILLSLTTGVYSQDADTQDSDSQDSKGYIGVSLGLAMPSGDIADDAEIKTGIDLGFINLGYRFTESIGVTANLISSGHVVGDEDEDVTLGIAYFGIGPTYTTNLGNTAWEIKPQVAFALTGKTKGSIFDDFTYKGSGFIIGNSFIFGLSGNFKGSINVDYLLGEIKEIEYDGTTVEADENENTINKFVVGFGLRYTF